MEVRTITRRLVIQAALFLCVGVAHADYFDDVGYSELLAEFGSLPDGTGLTVTLVESCTDAPTPCDLWRPDPGATRVVTDGDGGLPVSAPFSGHATGSGSKFYANNSTAPGIGIPPSPAIAAYETTDWMWDGFLQFDGGKNGQPSATGSRIANHSWVGAYPAPYLSWNLEILHRLDWVIDRDDYVQVVGFTGSANPLLASAFNVVAVNRTNAPTNGGSNAVSGDPAYDTTRVRPNLVAPEKFASGATPRVASAVALMMDKGHDDPSLSNGSTTNRNGDTVRNAERAEVLKAALMAGADKATSNTFPTDALGDINDYRQNPADRTANGLDRRFGAGQLSVYNSYKVIVAGEQDSDEDGGTGAIGAFGFDYDSAFGGSAGSNTQGTYYFSTGAEAVEFFATLAWHVDITPGGPWSFSQDATLRNLDLYLYDVSDMGNWILVQSSTGTIDNTENIHALLDAGKDYALRVQAAGGQGSFNWDYGIAWRSHVPGDIDNDGDVDVADVVLMQQAVAGQILLSQPEHSRADVYPFGGDGRLDVSDMLALQKMAPSN